MLAKGGTEKMYMQTSIEVAKKIIWRWQRLKSEEKPRVLVKNEIPIQYSKTTSN